MKNKIISAIIISFLLKSVTLTDMYTNSDFIGKEQPKLIEETKKLTSLYQRNRT